MNKTLSRQANGTGSGTASKGRAGRNLRELLKQEALANAERDLLLAAEWLPLEEEACSLDNPGKSRNNISPRREVV
jgi:hypothetical protein